MARRRVSEGGEGLSIQIPGEDIPSKRISKCQGAEVGCPGTSEMRRRVAGVGLHQASTETW